MLFGVAAGMADYLQVDPALMRLLWVLAGLAGFGVAGYIIAAIIIPLEPETPADSDDDGAPPVTTAGEVVAGPSSPSAGRGNRVIGWLFIIFGLLLFINQIMPHWLWRQMWPLVLIALGIYLLVDRRGSR